MLIYEMSIIVFFCFSWYNDISIVFDKKWFLGGIYGAV